LDLFGEDVLPVLRKEYAALKPAHVPDPPTHAGRVAAGLAAQDAAARAESGQAAASPASSAPASSVQEA
ncbi:5,10-methylene tetrahydromethanopterin reductase, partial [Arthrobacter sp. ISL-28]|nr:5,10-methylene tetrahydromethanopterin reductase [Arthrobacter sp. ISL-28]